jgi:stage II sporulation protein D
VRIRGGWELHSLDGVHLRSGAALDAVLETGGSAWSLGGPALPAEGAALRPIEDGDLMVDDRRYPGALRVSRSIDRRYRIFVDTTMPRYLEGVVGGEIPAAFPRESQRTQAIVARTYALSRAPHALPGDPLLLSDSGRDDQEFTGISPVAEHRRVAEDAVRSTRGLVVLWQGRPLLTWYSSTCGGHTCPSGPVFAVDTLPPLAGVRCTDCRESKYFDWTAVLPAPDVVKAAALSGALEAFDVATRTVGDRATAFRVKAGGREVTVNAAEFRLAVGPSKLRSVLVRTARVADDGVHVTGNGWGHGVGLCQMGAKHRADTGSTAEEILALYYPGATVSAQW